MNAQDKVRQEIAGFLNQPVSALKDEVILSNLVTNSFVLVEMVIELQEAFGVRFTHEDLRDLKSVDQLSQLVASRLRETAQ